MNGAKLAKLTVLELMWPAFHTDLISLYSETQANLVQILKYVIRSEEANRNNRLEEWDTLKKYLDDKRLLDFLEQEPAIDDNELDTYVYLIKNTTKPEESDINYFSVAYFFQNNGEYTHVDIGMFVQP